MVEAKAVTKRVAEFTKSLHKFYELFVMILLSNIVNKRCVSYEFGNF